PDLMCRPGSRSWSVAVDQGRRMVNAHEKDVPTMKTPELLAAAKRHLYGNYRPAPVVFARGKGCELFDVDGRRFLDLCAGVAVSVVGHGHPTLTKAVAEQAGKLIHASNYFYNEPNVL